MLTQILTKINKKFDWFFLKSPNYYFTDLNTVHKIHKMSLVFYVIKNIAEIDLSQEEIKWLLLNSDVGVLDSANQNILGTLILRLSNNKNFILNDCDEIIKKLIYKIGNKISKDDLGYQAINLFFYKEIGINVMLSDHDIVEWIKNSDINCVCENNQNLLSYYLECINKGYAKKRETVIDYLIKTSDYSNIDIGEIIIKLSTELPISPLSDAQFKELIKHLDVNRPIKNEKHNRNLLMIYYENIGHKMSYDILSENIIKEILLLTDINRKTANDITLLELIFAIFATPSFSQKIKLSDENLSYIIKKTTVPTQLTPEAINYIITANKK